MSVLKSACASTIDHAHFIPCAIHLYSASAQVRASLALCSGVHLSLLVLLVSDILEFLLFPYKHSLFLAWFAGSVAQLQMKSTNIVCASLPPLCCFSIQQRERTQVGQHSNYNLTAVIVATKFM